MSVVSVSKATGSPASSWPSQIKYVKTSLPMVADPELSDRPAPILWSWQVGWSGGDVPVANGTTLAAAPLATTSPAAPIDFGVVTVSPADGDIGVSTPAAAAARTIFK